MTKNKKKVISKNINDEGSVETVSVAATSDDKSQ
jgi:hypothetical protein